MSPSSFSKSLILCSLLLLGFSTINASHICLETACSAANVEADIVFVVDSSNAFDQATFESIRRFLYTFVSGLTVTTIDSQVSIYAYGSSAQTVISLSAGSNLVQLQSAINTTLKYQGSAERNLFQALGKVQAEVTSANGLRNSDFKKVLVVISGDSWTGNAVPGSPLLTQLQQKFNVILSVGVGSKAIANQNAQLPQLTTATSNTFFVATLDQLSYASAWIAAYSCPGVQVSTPVPSPTTIPTQSPSVTCPLASLNYDVYLIVDVSNKASAADFSALKQALLDFVGPFSIMDGKTQFALVTTGMDSELYYTAFHNGQSRGDILTSITNLVQDDVAGQTLNLALNAIQGYLNQQFQVSNKILAYFTSTTDWDVDPTATMTSLKSRFSLQPVAVQWGSSASVSNLSKFAGANCVNTISNKANTATWIQSKMCSKVFC